MSFLLQFPSLLRCLLQFSLKCLVYFFSLIKKKTTKFKKRNCRKMVSVIKILHYLKIWVLCCNCTDRLCTNIPTGIYFLRFGSAMRNNSICHGFHNHSLIKANIDVKNSLDIINMNVFFILFFKRKLILYLLHGILCILSWCPRSKYFYYYAEGFFIQIFFCFFLFVWIF